jgi:hypothetical protein
MDVYRKQLFEKSGIEDILEILGAKPEVRVESENITLFIGFRNENKTRLFLEHVNEKNSLVHIIEDFTDNVENVIWKISEVVALSKVLENSQFIKLLIVIDCFSTKFLRMLKNMKKFLQNIEFYKESVGLILVNTDTDYDAEYISIYCEDEMLEKLKNNFYINKELVNVLLSQKKIIFSDDDHLSSFLDQQLAFTPIIPQDFYLHSIWVVSETFQRIHSFWQSSYYSLLDILFDPMLSALNFSTMPLDQQLIKAAQSFELLEYFDTKFTYSELINGTFITELATLNMSTDSMELELSKFNELHQKYRRISDCFLDNRDDNFFDKFLDAYARKFMEEMDSNGTAFGSCIPVNVVEKSIKDFMRQDILLERIPERIPHTKYGDYLSNVRADYIVNKYLALYYQVERAVEKLVAEQIATYFELYVANFSKKLNTDAFRLENIFEMVENWRVNSKHLKSPQSDHYSRMPIVHWYTDLFRPMSNDTFLEKLIFYETFLQKIKSAANIDDEVLEEERPLEKAYQERINNLYRNVKSNVTFSIIKTLMLNNTLKINNVIHNFNPVVANMINGRLFAEQRASEREIQQHLRILENHHHAVLDYNRFVSSFERFTQIFDIPLSATEWDELMAVQTEFDNFTDLTDESWVVPMATTHNWGRELLAARDVLLAASSGASLTLSYINDAGKWATARVTHMQNLVSSDIWMIKNGATTTLMDGILMLLNFFVRKMIK